MSQPNYPPDRSVELRQLELDAEERRRQEELARQAEEAAKLAELRSGARSSALGSAESYFTGRGVPYESYSDPINRMIDQILSGISQSDPNPGQYFSNIGERAWNEQEGARQSRFMQDLNNMFSPNFETQRIPFSLDDPYLSSIEAEQRSEADNIIRNMLERGVITPTGYGTAQADLEKQAPGVRARLNEVGTTALAEGQGQLRDIANTGRQTASTIALGQQFDPYSYSGEADRTFTDFISNLGDLIRSRVPGKLFETTGLAAIAGAGQGAQNTAFNPLALSGIIEEEDKDKGLTAPQPVTF